MMMKILSDEKLENIVCRHVTLSIKRDADTQAVIVYIAITQLFFLIRVDIAPPYIYSPYKFFHGKRRFEVALADCKTPETRAAVEYAKTLVLPSVQSAEEWIIAVKAPNVSGK